MRAVEVPFCLVDIGRHQRRAQILQIHPIGGELRRVRLDTDRRFLASADTDKTDAIHLRDLWREAGVGEIFHLRQRDVRRSQRQRQNRRVGRIGFAVDRRNGKIRRQVGSRGIDRLLHFLLGDVDVETEVELQRNDRTAFRTHGGHLLQPGYLAELALQRRGD